MDASWSTVKFCYEHMEHGEFFSKSLIEYYFRAAFEHINLKMMVFLLCVLFNCVDFGHDIVMNRFIVGWIYLNHMKFVSSHDKRLRSAINDVHGPFGARFAWSWHCMFK